MARPALNRNIKKSYPVLVKFNLAEKERLKQKSAQAGFKKLAPFVREVALKTIVKERVSKEILEMNRDLIGVYNNINQIAKLANGQKNISEQSLEELKQYMSQLQSVFHQLLK